MEGKYSAIVCSFIWPFSPGHSGGEIRDYHLLKHLLSVSNIKFISMTDAQPAGRQDYLRQFVEQYFEPSVLRKSHPQWVNEQALHRPWVLRFIGLMRGVGMPVWGLNYHRDISLVSYQIDGYVIPVLENLLHAEPPDFVFVTPQLNSVLLQLGIKIPEKTRTILLTYDVEAVRISSLAELHKGLAGIAWKMEAFRAERFERQNIGYFDGIVVVSDRDRDIMIDKYGLEPERVLTVENSVDVDYFSPEYRPMDKDNPHIVFIGNLAYRPNRDAAIRLLRQIMPRVRARIPSVRAFVVGERPDRELLKLHRDDLDVVTGPVADVRLYLQQASVACIPLQAGSGTKYKVLEALSAGRPVVCTSIAAEGLDIQPGTHFLVADSDEEIANACIRILEQPEAYQDMASRARQQIEQNYSWEYNLKKLDFWLKKIMQMPGIRN